MSWEYLHFFWNILYIVIIKSYVNMVKYLFYKKMYDLLPSYVSMKITFLIWLNIWFTQDNIHLQSFPITNGFSFLILVDSATPFCLLFGICLFFICLFSFNSLYWLIGLRDMNSAFIFRLWCWLQQDKYNIRLRYYCIYTELSIWLI